MTGKRGRPPKAKEQMIEEKLVVDEIMEKPLSELILEIKELLRRYRNEIKIETLEENGKISEVKITVRIQL